MPVASVHKSEIRRNSTVTFKRMVPDVKHKICSLYPKEIVFSIHKNPIIPACNANAPKDRSGEVDGIKYTFAEVGPGREVEDKSVDTGIQFLEKYEVRENIPARLVAFDCLGYSIDENQVVSDTQAARLWRARGLFVPDGENPTGDELRAAKAAWHEGAQREYDIAQADWSTNRKANNISGDARVAAHLLGKNPEWLGGLESSGQKPKSEIEQLTDLVKVLLADRLQGSVPAGSAAAPVSKGK